MEQFDFDSPAEIFVARGRGWVRQSMTYKRFPTVAEAIQYAIEIVGADKLAGTAIETETDRLDGARIRELYQHSRYPLHRAGTAG